MRDKGVSSFTIFKRNLFVKSVTSSCSDDTCCDACLRRRYIGVCVNGHLCHVDSI